MKPKYSIMQPMAHHATTRMYQHIKTFAGMKSARALQPTVPIKISHVRYGLCTLTKGKCPDNENSNGMLSVEMNNPP
jgi:hypothetical protein